MITSSAYLFRRLHRDERGNIGVLLLLTIMALVALLGLLWNTGETATRRQHVQTAADTTAHSASTWISRTLNAVTAQNMLICQDASAETIWRAVPPTSQWLRDELNRELAEVQQMIAGNDPNFAAGRQRILDALAGVDNRYQLIQASWDAVNAQAANVEISDPQQRQQFLDRVRQAGEAIRWIQNTYVDGQPGGPRRPGPPGPNGEGLRQLVANWKMHPSNLAELNMILQAIQQELAVLDAFDQRTRPGLGADVPDRLHAHQQEIYQNERRMVDLLVQTLEQQRSILADFYKCDTTYAASSDAKSNGPGRGLVPIIPADQVQPVTNYYDSIRNETITIDPINVHADFARIAYPDIVEPTPSDLLSKYPGLPGSFTINCDYDNSEGWGHDFCAPLSRYFFERLGRDLQILRDFLRQIDDIRDQLRNDLAFPTPGNIAPLPYQLSDSVPDPQDPAGQNYPMIHVLPRLDDTLRPASLGAAIATYNTNAGRYTAAVRTLSSNLQGMANYFGEFTRHIAVRTWYSSIRAAREIVLKQLGVDRPFYVMASYQLRPIPDWAKANLNVSAEAWIHNAIMENNLFRVTQAILNAIAGIDPQGLGGDFTDTTARDQFLRATYSEDASKAALRIVTDAADRVAPIIAAEYVNRPWPYEVAPASENGKVPQGLTDADRLNYFSLLVGAKNTDQTKVRLALSKIFSGALNPQVAFAQAETFNWNEYHENYGVSDHYDQVNFQADYVVTASPRCWRLSTVGGWSWNPRLSLSDGLSPALLNNPDFQQFFQDGGVTSHDPQAIKSLILH